LYRQYQRAWKGSELFISETDRERLRVITGVGKSAVDEYAAEKLKLDDKIRVALKTLRLRVWSTEEEMEKNYIYLVKENHPD
jgi:hypothetical protein